MVNERRHPQRGDARTVRRISLVIVAAVLLLTTGDSGNALRAQAASAAQSQGLPATKEAVARAQELLIRAHRLEQERKLQEAFDAARAASRTLDAITGLAELARRQYMQGTIQSLLGKIFADNNQYDEAIASWTEAMRFYSPLYNSDVEFWQQASRPGSDFEHAASNIATTLGFLAQVSEALKKPEDALRYLGQEGDFFEKLDDHDRVIECRRRSLTVIEANPSLAFASRRRAQAVADVAAALINGERAAEALPLLEQASKAVSGAPRTPDPELALTRANVRFLTGYALNLAGRHAEAVPALLEAASGFAALGTDVPQQLRALERAFASLYALGRFPQAVDVLKQRIDLARRTPGFERDEYTAGSHLALVYIRSGATERAAAEFTALKQLAARAKIPVSDRVRALVNEGVMRRDSREHRLALDCFNAAIALLETQPGTEAARARYQIDVATALAALRRHDEARAALQRGITLSGKGPEGAVVAAELHRSLAEDSERRLGQRGAVARQCEQTIAALDKTPGAADLILGCLVDLGREQQRLGRADQAVGTFRQALDRLDAAAGTPGGRNSLDRGSNLRHSRWVALVGLGLALVAAGRNDEAATQLLTASELGRDRYLEALAGMTLLDRHQFMETDRKSAAAARIAVALSFQSADVNAARAFDASLSRKTLFTEISRRQHEALRAAAARDPALMQRYVELRQQVARHVIDWQRAGTTGAESDAVEALFKEIGEIEARLLRSVPAGAGASAIEGSPSARIASSLGRDEVLLEFVRFAPLTAAAIRELDIPALAPDDATQQHYGVFIVSGSTRQLTRVDLGAASRVDDAVLEYRAIHQRQSAPETFKLDEAEMAKASERLRRLVYDPLSAQLRGARRIYVAPEGPLSLVPFETFPVPGAGPNTRYLIEDFEIVYVNTGRDLLRPVRASPPARSREVWLVGDPDFDATEAALAASVGTTRASPGRLIPVSAANALLANVPLMGSPGGETLRDWARLGRTRELLDKIAEMTAASNLTPVMLTGALASEANLTRMHAPRVAVFATHGKFLDRGSRLRFTFTSWNVTAEDSKMEGLSAEELLAADPLFRSMLVVAGANRAGKDQAGKAWDGLLTAYEVWSLDLQGTELVALTACETGLGVVQGAGASGSLRQPSGEVVAGLRQAFIVAGVKSMLMSMWPVPLSETVRSFGLFFERWLGGGESRYLAFRQSQLEALRYARERRGSGHPFWWAGFVYFGDPGDTARP